MNGPQKISAEKVSSRLLDLALTIEGVQHNLGDNPEEFFEAMLGVGEELYVTARAIMRISNDELRYLDSEPQEKV